MVKTILFNTDGEQILNMNHNLLLRVAVHEVETWLIADKRNFSRFLGIREGRIETNVEEIVDPKRYLIDLVRASGKNI